MRHQSDRLKIQSWSRAFSFEKRFFSYTNCLNMSSLFQFRSVVKICAIYGLSAISYSVSVYINIPIPQSRERVFSTSTIGVFKSTSPWWRNLMVRMRLGWDKDIWDFQTVCWLATIVKRKVDFIKYKTGRLKAILLIHRYKIRTSHTIYITTRVSWLENLPY